MSNDDDTVTLSPETRVLLRELAQRVFDSGEDASYQQMIQKLADDRLSAAKAEEQAIEEAQQRLRRRVFDSRDTPSDDEETLSDDESAAQKQRELAEELFN